MLVLVGGRVDNTALAGKKVSAIAHNAQLISENLAARVAEKDSVFADSWWPTDLDARRINSARIPPRVFVRASNWLRTMIKPEWLPEDPNAWMIGIQKEHPVKADYLILRYQIEGIRVQIQETGAAACVLIDTGTSTDIRADAFLTSMVRKFLRYPEDKLGALEFFLKSFEHEGKKIDHGTMDCDFDRYDTEAYFRRIWYNHTCVWTDRRRAFFSLVERDGQPPKRKQARAGIARRFQPAE
jgi:hypothetical protein